MNYVSSSGTRYPLGSLYIVAVDPQRAMDPLDNHFNPVVMFTLQQDANNYMVGKNSTWGLFQGSVAWSRDLNRPVIVFNGEAYGVSQTPEYGLITNANSRFWGFTTDMGVARQVVTMPHSEGTLSVDTGALVQ